MKSARPRLFARIGVRLFLYERAALEVTLTVLYIYAVPLSAAPRAEAMVLTQNGEKGTSNGFQSFISASGPSVELGPFELRLLASIKRLAEVAWGSNLQADLSRELGRDVAVGQLSLALSKLERRGLISSEKSDPEPVRGGRSKKVFRLETPGARALERTAAVVNAPGVLRPMEIPHGESAI